MKLFKDFIKEANFNVNASSRPELARFINRGRANTQQTQAYPVQTQATSRGGLPFSSSIQPSRQAATNFYQNYNTGVDDMVNQLMDHPMHKAFTQQPQQAAAPQQTIAPAVTQRNVATASYPVQTTAPAQAQQFATGKNGQLTPKELKPVGKYNAGPSGSRQWYGNTALLNPKAADAFLAAQQAFGQQIPINSAYRNLEHQKGLSKEGHKVVGRAGTSRHGLGAAIDIQPNTPAYNWLTRNGSQFGWYFASIPGDPYHFEFRG
jgi:LAS superfamily LD-carboxypeptidase LdcB